MRVLAFDTALSGCSVACYDGTQGAFEISSMDRGQAEDLIPMISRVLARAGADYADVEKVITTVGPGAFTGLRIGLSTARALGLALDVPVAGLSTFDVIAEKFRRDPGQNPNEILCILLETRRTDFYVRLSNEIPQCLDAAAIEERLSGKKVVFIGDALTRFRSLTVLRNAQNAQNGQGGQDGQDRQEGQNEWRFVAGYELPDPRLMAEMGAAGDRLLPPEPLYLRGADVTIPRVRFKTSSKNHPDPGAEEEGRGGIDDPRKTETRTKFS